MKHFNVVIGEREQEACKREQAAKEKEWDKLNQMEQKKLELEATIAELERTKGDAQIDLSPYKLEIHACSNPSPLFPSTQCFNMKYSELFQH